MNLRRKIRSISSNKDKVRFFAALISIFIIVLLTMFLFFTKGSGSVSLTWKSPTTKVDGSRLTDLAGYNIYYGTSPGVYEKKVTLSLEKFPMICKQVNEKQNFISEDIECNYIIKNINPGIYYFAVTAFTLSGYESRYSNERSKVAK